jgi:hypothetical protein
MQVFDDRFQAESHSITLGLHYPEDEGTTTLRIIGTYSLKDTAFRNRVHVLERGLRM